MRLLVIRTSAMGDVALTAPVVTGFCRQYPDSEIIMVTRQVFIPFFQPELKIFAPDFKARHKGFSGIFRLYKDIRREYKIDRVIDLHNVLRSRILTFFFRLSGVPVDVINKGRIEKRALISGKRVRQLKHTVERYCDVFAKAGFPVEPSRDISIFPSAENLEKAQLLLGNDKVLNIGVAPFAKHKLKMWPAENMMSLLQMISQKHECRFWIFGGPEDSDGVINFMRQVPNSRSLIGKLTLGEELAVISRLSVMIAMDSSNMHMAALTGTKVISIWGATDPLTGFGAWMQPDNFSLRIPVDELKCRPCTVYGKGECLRRDFACMHWLTPELIFKKINNLNIL